MDEDRLHAAERAEGFVVLSLFALGQVLDTDKGLYEAEN